MVFTKDSYWNTPIPADAQIDPDSDRFVEWLARENKRPYLALGTGTWSMPFYRVTDPTLKLTTIKPLKWGPTVTCRVPWNAQPMEGDDRAMVVIDETTNQDVSFFEFYRTTTGIRTTAVARYWLNSNGLHEDVEGGTAGNEGHRGVPGSVSCITKRDLNRRLIDRRLKIAVPGTAPWHVFPMAGDEGDKGGIIGEGMVMRLRPGVTSASAQLMTILVALQTYGVLVGDNGGVATLKCQRGITIDPESLGAIGWNNFEFIHRDTFKP